MAGRRPLSVIDGVITELPADQPLAPLPVQGTTLQHVNGVVTVDPSEFTMSQFVGDTFVPAVPTIVATATASAAATGRPIALPGVPQENDFVVIFCFGPDGPSGSVSSSGYAGYGWGINNRRYLKKLGASPDTSVTFSSLPSGGALILLLRGVGSPGNSISTQHSSGSNAVTPDPSSISTSVDNALVLCCISSNANLPTTAQPPAGFSFVHGGIAGSTPSVCFSRLVPYSGFVDPGPYGTPLLNWSSFVTAWRPGPGSGEKDYTVQFTNLPQGNLLYQGRLMLVVQATGGSFAFPGAQWLNAPPDFSATGTYLVDYTLNSQGAYLVSMN
jgi:hypothetical protein